MTNALFSRSELFTIRQTINAQYEPASLYQTILSKNKQEHSMLFESASTDDQRALKSMLITKVALRITALKTVVKVEALSPVGQELLTILQRAFPDSHQQKTLSITDFQFSNDKEKYPRGVLSILDPLLALQNAELSPFIGGLFGYDLVGEFYQIPVPDNGRERDLCLYFAESLISYDHQTQISYFEQIFHHTSADSRLEAYRQFTQQLQSVQRYIDLNRSLSDVDFPTLSQELSTGLAENSHTNSQSYSTTYPQSYPQLQGVDAIMSVKNGISIPDSAPFKESVKDFIGQIKAGKLLQIVPSRTFSLPCKNPFNSYLALKSTYPSPYLFYLHDPEFILFGASPESAVKFHPLTREIEIYPIAGTKRRGMIDGEIDEVLDQEMERVLKNDPKEVAEHLMLVDLAKEDLSPISDESSVEVRDLLKVDRYRYVMHLVSRVVGRLKQNLTPIDAYLAVMNMGTLTGAPKIYAMKEIYRYEKTARGSFGGAIGYIQATPEGEYFDSAIVIRSAYVQKGIAKIQAGAGIVEQSNPESEVAETENKASSIIAAILKINMQHI